MHASAQRVTGSGHELARAIGRQSRKDDFTGVYRLVAFVVSPESLLRNTACVYRLYDSMGVAEILEEMPPIDRELGNWFTSAHPDSHFKNRLIVARAADEGRRFTLLNDQLKVRAHDGHADVTTIATPEALLGVLAERFGLNFSDDTRFGPAGSPWPS